MMRFFKTFLLLLIIYVGLLTFVFTIPNKYLSNNQQASFTILDSEGNYPSLSKSDWQGTRLDNFTDKLMIEKSKKKETNPLIAAISINDYPRYWHGYQVVLRPLLVFTSYGGIRQIYGFIVMLLIGTNLFFLIKKTDIFFSLSFFLCFYFIRFQTLFISMQFSNVFVVMLIFNLYILIRDMYDLKSKKYLLEFFLAGSLTNFVDLLTAPLVTLGVPLITLLYLCLKTVTTNEKITLQYLKNIFFICFSWGIGYGGTWAFKWIIASFVLRKNIIFDAVNQAIFRTEGNQQYPLDRSDMLKRNIGLILNHFNSVIFVLLVLLVIVLVIRKRDVVFRKFINRNSFYLLLIMIFPYIWYLAMANHSQIHYYFTYRAQIITVFSFLSFLSFILSEISKGNENLIVSEEKLL